MTAAPRFAFDNSYARDLQGFYVAWNPTPVPAPTPLFINHTLAEELGVDLTEQTPQALAALFAGNELPEGALPLAQAYAGHQFGHFSPQLGDGRALLIGEVINRHGQRRDIAFKGSGRTPFSRNGDGKAAVGPMLREVLIGEAMHALGIPTTRALAVVGTGERVYREEALPGAILTRVAASHIRVGTFEYFAARGEAKQIRILADYTIARHYPDLAQTPSRYLEFLRAVAERQALLVSQWLHVGFIHGVMNTDNMALSGETIDFGPCAFMEAYNPRAVFSSIDQQGRYSYANQPNIVRWNLARLAETLLPLLAVAEEDAIKLATEVIDAFPVMFQHHWLQGARAKLGLATGDSEQEEGDAQLVQDWLELLQQNNTDFTLAWRRLADAATGNDTPLLALISDYDRLKQWLQRWQNRCAEDDARAGVTQDNAARRAAAMCKTNPWLIPRNHRVEEALTAASDEGNLQVFETLLEALRHPFDENPAHAHLAEPAPAQVTACYKTFCGT